MKQHFFLTGGTGLVGGNLLQRFVKADPNASITLLIRAASETEAKQRLQSVWREWALDPERQQIPSQIRVLCGDVTQPQLGLSDLFYQELAESVTHILHSAATVKFNLSLDEARAINCLGTRHVIDLARRASRCNLEHVGCVSTAYVCGTRTGLIRESELECDQGFANTYEQAKFESEKELRALQSELPLSIFRPSIIIGDSQTGKTTSFNVLYHPLKLFYKGHLSLIPGNAETRLDVIPVDYVADTITHVLLHSESFGKTYHLTAGLRRSSRAGEISKRAIDYFNRVGSKALKPPQFISLEMYESLRAMAPPAIQEAMKKMDFYLPYLINEHDFDDTNTQNALSETSIRLPLLTDYLERTLDHCIKTGWGETR
jgi:long-chain acyl-CoA synthetase